MWNDLGEFLNTAVAVVAIATLAGLGFLQGKQKRLRQDLTDEEHRHQKTLDREAEANAKVLALTATVQQHAAKIETLEQQVSAKAEWELVISRLEVLGQALMDHNEAVREHWSTEEALLREALERGQDS